MTKIWLSKFDAKNKFVALKKLQVAVAEGAVTIDIGEEVDKNMFTARRLRLLYEQRKIGVAGDVLTEKRLPPKKVKAAEKEKSPAPPVITDLGGDNKQPVVLLPPEVVKKLGRWYVLRGDEEVFGPNSKSQCELHYEGLLREDMLRDQAA